MGFPDICSMCKYIHAYMRCECHQLKHLKPESLQSLSTAHCGDRVDSASISQTCLLNYRSTTVWHALISILSSWSNTWKCGIENTDSLTSSQKHTGTTQTDVFTLGVVRRRACQTCFPSLIYQPVSDLSPVCVFELETLTSRRERG